MNELLHRKKNLALRSGAALCCALMSLSLQAQDDTIARTLELKREINKTIFNSGGMPVGEAPQGGSSLSISRSEQVSLPKALATPVKDTVVTDKGFLLSSITAPNQVVVSKEELQVLFSNRRDRWVTIKEVGNMLQELKAYVAGKKVQAEVKYYLESSTNDFQIKSLEFEITRK